MIAALEQTIFPCAPVTTLTLSYPLSVPLLLLPHTHAPSFPPPLKYSAAISLCGSVLAIGGRHDNEHSTAIHVYQPATNNWSKVGDLPCPLSYCSCALLSSGQILVAGGIDSNGKRSSRVDVATL